jgi:hypothetical protein
MLQYWNIAPHQHKNTYDTPSGKEHSTNPRIIHENLCYVWKQQEFFQQCGAYNKKFSGHFS